MCEPCVKRAEDTVVLASAAGVIEERLRGQLATQGAHASGGADGIDARRTEAAALGYQHAAIGDFRLRREAGR